MNKIRIVSYYILILRKQYTYFIQGHKIRRKIRQVSSLNEDFLTFLKNLETWKSVFPLDLSWFSINTYQVLCCPDPRTVSFVPFHILYPWENFSEDRQTSVILKIYFTFPIIYSFWNIYSFLCFYGRIL